jgi:HNH endonuclease
MPLARKQKNIRTLVSKRAFWCCEYCKSPDFCSPSPFNVEHIESTVQGGTDTIDNLAWSCGGCNGHKGIAQESTDPESEEVVPLYHPRRDRWEEHFSWSADGLTIQPQTATGRVTVARLQLNRDEVLALRHLLILGKQHPPEKIS